MIAIKLAQEAYHLLYQDREFPYEPSLKYSGKFKAYNANVKLRGNKIHFSLCRKWKAVSREIQIGLIQELLLRITKDKQHHGSVYIDLYNNFVKRLHIAIPKTESDPPLASSFSRVNERYFLGMVEQPNIRWGAASRRKLGSYDFKTDTITISSIFKAIEPELMDYVMYHEMLHKQHKYRAGRSRHCYHDKKFRDAEHAFENHKEVEQRLHKALRYAKLGKIGRFLFGGI